MEILVILFFWVGLSAVVSVAANTRGRDAAGWFFLALLISPLLAGLLVLALPPVAVATSAEIKPTESLPDGYQRSFQGFPYKILDTAGRVEVLTAEGPRTYRTWWEFTDTLLNKKEAPKPPEPQPVRRSDAPIEATKTCPQCAESVKVAAKVCRFCRYEFSPRSETAQL
jgi:hypothetical protein